MDKPDQALPAAIAQDQNMLDIDGLPTAQIVFTPSGKRGWFPHGTMVLEAARRLGVDLDSLCGGRGICGRCQVLPSFGDFSKLKIKSSDKSLSAFNKVEDKYRNLRGLKNERRLGCQCRIQGDIVIDVPPDSQVHQQIIRKRAETRNIRINPSIALHYVRVEQPDMHHPSGDFERLQEALRSQWRLGTVTCGLAILQLLQNTLRDGNWEVTVAIQDRREIIAIWPGFVDRGYGAAIDIGSTTMSVHLTDLRTGEVVSSMGAMNPQIRFGEDLMSRVSYVMMNEDKGVEELTNAVQERLNELIGEAAKEADVPNDQILELVLVGNPIMHHLMMGISPKELGWAPFALATNQPVNIYASQIGIEGTVHPGAKAYILPCVAGHVGADAAAVVLSENPQLLDEVSLIVDIGTNAEIICGNREKLLACSSPTGPALEGAQISSGQRAANGAIERVRIDKTTLEPRFKVIGCDKWSDEDGFWDEVKNVGITGICGSGILEVLGEMLLAGIINTDGVIEGNMAEKSPRIEADARTFSYLLHKSDNDGPDVRILQSDVRAIQLAKAALYAGAKLLIDQIGRPPDRIVLAGAFGSHIDPLYAMVLGLIPDCDLDRVTPVGNAAGTGARIALLDKKARAGLAQTVRNITKIETAVEPKFQEHFIDAMALPHKRDAFPHLETLVDLPKPSADNASGDGAEGGRRGRRRRR